MAHVPFWITLLLSRPLSGAELAALPLPKGFLAWLEDGPLPPGVLDLGASEEPPTGTTVCRLQISGGTNELELQEHQQPAALRKMGAEMRANFALISKAPGDTAPSRIISAAAMKGEALSKCLGALCRMDWAVGVVLPHANHQAFSAREFAARLDRRRGARQRRHKALEALDRVVSPEPAGDLAGVILWPRGTWNVPGGVAHVWSLVPFVASELADFRTGPGQQSAWLLANTQNIAALLDRWSHAAK